MSITASLANEGAAFRELNELGKGLTDLKPLFRNISLELEKNFEKRFNARIDPDGRGWMPWADSTAAQRSRQKRGKLLEFSNPGMRDSVRRRFDNKSASLVMLSPIAAYHEQQTAPKKGRLPRRAMLNSKGGGLGAMDQKSVVLASNEYFRKLLA